MPFITYTKVKSLQKSERSKTPQRHPSTINGMITAFDNYVPEEKGVIRPYSPVPRAKLLDDEDTYEAYETRMLELGNDFDDCRDIRG